MALLLTKSAAFSQSEVEMQIKKFICPEPGIWNDVFKNLKSYASKNDCNPKEPPAPLVLGRWFHSSDKLKEERWNETKNWARVNNCSHLLSELNSNQFHFVLEELKIEHLRHAIKIRESAFWDREVDVHSVLYDEEILELTSAMIINDIEYIVLKDRIPDAERASLNKTLITELSKMVSDATILSKLATVISHWILNPDAKRSGNIYFQWKLGA